MTLLRRRRKRRQPACSSSTPTPTRRPIAVLRDPRRAARASRSSSPTSRDGAARRRLLRRPRCQYPGATGARARLAAASIAAAHERGALVAVAADLLALTLLRAARRDRRRRRGRHHAALRRAAGLRRPARRLPGRPRRARAPAARPARRRLASTPTARPALPARAADPRAAHPPREGDVSNICTAQVLLAVMAAHVRRLPRPRRPARASPGASTASPPILAAGLRAGGVEVVARRVLRHRHGARARPRRRGRRRRARAPGSTCAASTPTRVGIACDETDRPARTSRRSGRRSACRRDVDALDAAAADALPAGARAARATFLTHPVFHAHRSETAMLRYLRRLADRDLALDRSDDPARLVHDEAQRDDRDGADHLARSSPACTRSRPLEQAAGYRRADRRPRALAGRDHRLRRGVAAAQRRHRRASFAGLLAIRAYHRSRGEHAPRRLPDPVVRARHQRGVGGDGRACGSSWSACDDRRQRRPRRPARQDRPSTRDRLAALMVTYPSTHGVFEADDRRDLRGRARRRRPGLRRRRQPQRAGRARPARARSAPTSRHLNLHKTFCIPHGGGGPGVGPVAVRAHLAPFLPNHPLAPEAGPATGVGAGRRRRRAARPASCRSRGRTSG